MYNDHIFTILYCECKDSIGKFDKLMTMFILYFVKYSQFTFFILLCFNLFFILLILFIMYFQSISVDDLEDDLRSKILEKDSSIKTVYYNKGLWWEYLNSTFEIQFYSIFCLNHKSLRI